MADNQDALVAQFAEITGALPEEARNYLATNKWDISAATTEYFAALDEDGEDDYEGGEPSTSHAEEPYTGPRTLDGRPAPESTSAAGSSSRSAPPKRGGIATLGSLGSGSAGGHGHGHAHDSDDDDEPEGQPRDLFAGGEKSGLAVQDPSRKNDPKRLVNEILKKARANAERGGAQPPAAAPSRFRGAGQTLGDDSTPSQAVPDPHASSAPEPDHVTRTLHIWEEGFSIEDGELRRFDDPQHARDLQMIQQGRAPLHLMGVRPDQPVDVQLIQHNEKFKPIPKVYKPFSGQGQRLGSPTPGASSTITNEPAPTTQPQTSSSSAPQEPQIDNSQPTVSLRLQLADGTRLPARFNTTSTIGDVYNFINQASSSGQRPWVLATTFPNKDHTDKSLQLGDVPEFKRGGTAVQKWL